MSDDVLLKYLRGEMDEGDPRDPETAELLRELERREEIAGRPEIPVPDFMDADDATEYLGDGGKVALYGYEDPPGGAATPLAIARRCAAGAAFTARTHVGNRRRDNNINESTAAQIVRMRKFNGTGNEPSKPARMILRALRYDAENPPAPGDMLKSEMGVLIDGLTCGRAIEEMEERLSIARRSLRGLADDECVLRETKGICREKERELREAKLCRARVLRAAIVIGAAEGRKPDTAFERKINDALGKTRGKGDGGSGGPKGKVIQL